MGKVKGFKEFDRIDEKYLPIRNRLKNYNEFTVKVKSDAPIVPVKVVSNAFNKLVSCAVILSYSTYS